MSNVFINIRFLWFHLQAERGSLWVWRIGANDFWRERGKWRTRPFQIYEFDLRGGWVARNRGVEQASAGTK